MNVLPFLLRSYGHVYKVCEFEVYIFEMQAYEFANLECVHLYIVLVYQLFDMLTLDMVEFS